LKTRKNMSPTKILLLGMIFIILIGTLILKLPISNKPEKRISMLDAFFTSTSAVCVTGLVTKVPAEQFSDFGKIIIICLIQIGGLGFMTLISLILTFIGRKINLSDRIIIKESLNQDDTSGMVKLIKSVCKYAFSFEILGALLLSIRFIPQFGLKRGAFYSIFHSISAFCNAGFDILGSNSLINYGTDKLISITIMGLIIVGGLGFTVWSDIFAVLKKEIRHKLRIKRIFRKLSLHTKIVLVMTVILLISGTIIFYCLEHNSKYIMEKDSFGTKILKAAFQSTTLRTAGFASVNQTELTTASKFISICFMFIGGSPASTSGGIKTTTLAVLVLCVTSVIKGKNEINAFGKSISFEVLKRAIVIFTISILLVIFATVILLVTEISFQEERLHSNITKITAFSFIDLFFEVVSAFGTVGLTLNVTTKLSVVGKIVIAIMMLIGRLGPITISVALFKKNKEKGEEKLYPPGNILIG